MAAKCDLLKSPNTRHSPATHAAVGVPREAGSSCGCKVTSGEGSRAGRSLLSPWFQSFSRPAGASSVGCPQWDQGAQEGLQCGGCLTPLQGCPQLWAPAREQLSLCHPEGNEGVINEQLYLQPVSGCCSSPWVAAEGSGLPQAGATQGPPQAPVPKGRHRGAPRRRIPFLSRFLIPVLPDLVAGTGRGQCKKQHLSPDFRLVDGLLASFVFVRCRSLKGILEEEGGPFWPSQICDLRVFSVLGLFLWIFLNVYKWLASAVTMEISEILWKLHFVSFHSLSVKDDCFFSFPSVSHHILYCQAIT